MDVYLNAVFCPLAMVDKAVFEQEGWHRDADGTVSGVVYNEMQGALASPGRAAAERAGAGHVPGYGLRLCVRRRPGLHPGPDL